MNKNFKLFQIHGLSGLLLLGFISTCLFCGFILFPVWGVMIAWNELIAKGLEGPVINFFQASLLWSIVILFIYLTLRNSISIKIHTANNDVDEEELKKLIHEMDEVKNTPEE